MDSEVEIFNDLHDSNQSLSYFRKLLMSLFQIPWFEIIGLRMNLRFQQNHSECSNRTPFGQQF